MGRCFHCGRRTRNPFFNSNFDTCGACEQKARSEPPAGCIAIVIGVGVMAGMGAIYSHNEALQRLKPIYYAELEKREATVLDLLPCFLPIAAGAATYYYLRWDHERRCPKCRAFRWGKPPVCKTCGPTPP